MDSGNTYAHGFPLSAYSCTSLQSRKPLSSEGYHMVLPTKTHVKKEARLEYTGKGTGKGSLILRYLWARLIQWTYFFGHSTAEPNHIFFTLYLTTQSGTY